jgi:hypothetical protein
MRILFIACIVLICGVLLCRAVPQLPTPSEIFSAGFQWAESSEYAQDSFNVYSNGNVS